MLPLPTELMLRRKEDNQYLLLTYTFKSRSVAKKKKKKKVNSNTCGTYHIGTTIQFILFFSLRWVMER